MVVLNLNCSFVFSATYNENDVMNQNVEINSVSSKTSSIRFFYKIWLIQRTFKERYHQRSLESYTELVKMFRKFVRFFYNDAKTNQNIKIGLEGSLWYSFDFNLKNLFAFTGKFCRKIKSK